MVGYWYVTARKVNDRILVWYNHNSEQSDIGWVQPERWVVGYWFGKAINISELLDIGWLEPEKWAVGYWFGTTIKVSCRILDWNSQKSEWSDIWLVQPEKWMVGYLFVFGYQICLFILQFGDSVVFVCFPFYCKMRGMVNLLEETKFHSPICIFS